MQLLEHPSRYAWTFGNHEPLLMYRRIGKKSTGGVMGGARWLEQWHHWYDSEECAATMADLGFNLLHCRYYKGMGWEKEKEDYERVLPFVRSCRKHGITVLAYVQYSSLYPEIMRKEIPHLADWASLDEHGNIHRYIDSYWRWMPCPNRPGFVEYIDQVLTRLIKSGEFDGVMFDNIFSFPCYCPDCRRKFAEELAKQNPEYLYPEFVELPPPETPEENMDPVAQSFVRFRQQTVARTFAHFHDLIKSLNPDFVISGNFPIHMRYQGLTYYNTPPLLLAPSFDVVLSQTGTEPAWNGTDSVNRQTWELKTAEALHTRAVPLNDTDAGGSTAVGARYIGGLFESLFGGSIPVDRIIMKPKRGGELNREIIAERRPVLDAMHRIAKEYETLLERPNYEPVGLLTSDDSLTLSKKSHNDFQRCQESLLCGHVPFRLVMAKGDWIDREALAKCDTLILPGARCLSDAVVKEIQAFRGRLVLAGDEVGDYDENYCQRAAAPFAETTERVKITPHDISKADWVQEIHFLSDDWGKRFAAEIVPELHPGAQAIIKLFDNGRVAGVLMSAPLSVPGGKIRIPAARRAEKYEWVTWNDKHPAEFQGDEISLPPFDGMLMLCALPQ